MRPQRNEPIINTLNTPRSPDEYFITLTRRIQEHQEHMQALAAERDRIIASVYEAEKEQGATFATIGARFHVNESRIGQIIRRHKARQNNGTNDPSVGIGNQG